MRVTALNANYFVFKAVTNIFSMKKKIVFISLLFLLSFALLIPTTNAQTADPTLNGLNLTADQVDAFDTGGVYDTFLQTRLGTIVGVVLSFVGVLFLVLVIYAGISWMTANGNEQQVKKARDLIINSIIGAIIVFAAYAITSFVGNQILK